MIIRVSVSRVMNCPFFARQTPKDAPPYLTKTMRRLVLTITSMR
jgi:hypothetical protein